MTLSQKQQYFGDMFTILLVWAKLKGYKFSIGEVFRPPEMQRIYEEQKKTWTSYSRHQDKLAVDLFLYKNGRFSNSIADYRPLAKFWKMLDEKNRWGGDWSTKDIYHFEYAG